MTTPKELHIEIGDIVKFKPTFDADRDLGMFAGVVGQVLDLDSQQLVWDFDFIANGMLGQCTYVAPRDPSFYKFQRVRENGSLGDVSMPVKPDDDCIEKLVLRQLKMWP